MPAKSICFEQEAFSGKVSPKGFQDVSLLTGGMEAEGHGIYLDEKSVETCMAAVMGRSIPSYLTHAGAQTDRLGKEIGVASGTYRDGMKVRASNLNFLDSFGRHETAARDRLVELATNYPDQLGISLVLSLDAVWVLHDGSEIDASEPRPENAVREIPSARIKSVRSADLVQRPAANVGLFSAKTPPVDDHNEGMATANSETIALSAHTAALASKDAELSTLKASLEKLTADHKAAFEKQTADHKAALDKLTGDHTAALSAKDKDKADAIAAKDKEIAEIKLFDVRNHGGQGATAVTAAAGAVSAAVVMPEPAAKDHQRWEQYDELMKKDVKLAAEFKSKFLSVK